MNKKEKLELKLEKVWHVFTFAQETYLYTEYLHNPVTPEELNFVKQSQEMRTIMHLMFRTMIIEVCKLFSTSDNDNFQLKKFISSLSQSGEFRAIGLSNQHVDKWLMKLENNKSVIDAILILRNKIYAHTDNPMNDYGQIDISFKQIKILLDIASEIIQSIYNEVFDTQVLFNPLTFNRERFPLLKLLAKAEEQRVNEIMEKYKRFTE